LGRQPVRRVRRTFERVQSGLWRWILGTSLESPTELWASFCSVQIPDYSNHRVAFAPILPQAAVAALCGPPQIPMGTPCSGSWPHRCGLTSDLAQLCNSKLGR
jgi:hypothetical protein